MTFVIGGAMTTLIVALEESGHRTLSGFAALFPIFTLTAYLFLGETKGGAAVGQHSWFVLVGTLVSWIPYMLTIALLAPRYGTAKAVPAGLAVFLVLTSGYLWLVSHYRWFR